MKLIAFRKRRDKHDIYDLNNTVNLLKSQGINVTTQYVIDKLEEIYGANIPQLKEGALEFIYGLPRY